MKCTVAILLAVTGALVFAQEDVVTDNGEAVPAPVAYSPPGSSPVVEQRAVDRQNQALSVAFERAFPANTPEEFRAMVVALYVRCQAELDNCAELLWATHLLREYRMCAITQRRFCDHEVSELQAQLAVMAEETLEQYVLSPEETELLS